MKLTFDGEVIDVEGEECNEQQWDMWFDYGREGYQQDLVAMIAAATIQSRREAYKLYQKGTHEENAENYVTLCRYFGRIDAVEPPGEDEEKKDLERTDKDE